MYGHVPLVINNKIEEKIKENLMACIDKRINEYLPAKIAQIKADLWEDDLTNILQNGEVKISKWDISTIVSGPLLINEVLKETDLTYDKSSEDISTLIDYASKFYEELKEGGYIQNKIRKEIKIEKLELEVEEEKTEVLELFSKLWKTDIIEGIVYIINPYKILTSSLEKLIMNNKDSTYLIERGYKDIASSPIINIINKYSAIKNKNELMNEDNEFISAVISYTRDNILVDNRPPEDVKAIAISLLDNSLYCLYKIHNSEWVDNLLNKLIDLNINKKVFEL